MRKIVLCGFLLILSPVVLGAQQCKDISQLTALRYWDNPFSPYDELKKQYKSPIERKRTEAPVQPKAAIPKQGMSGVARPGGETKTAAPAKLVARSNKQLPQTSAVNQKTKASAVKQKTRTSAVAPTKSRKTIRQVLGNYADRNGYQLVVRKNDNILLDKQSALGEIQTLGDLSIASNGRIRRVFVNDKTNELRIK